MKKTLSIAVIFMMALAPISAFADQCALSEDLTVKDDLISFDRKDTSFYSTFFQKQLYDPTVGTFAPTRLWRILTFSQPDVLDVNRYDEVIDSSFFTNRHAKESLTVKELVNAPLPSQDPGPSMDGPWTVLKGKTDGVTPGFFIKDSKGYKFLLKFDPRANPEMTTSAEMITHKFFHAFGYNVPSYSLVKFDPSILQVSPDATYYNIDGFKKPLTQEKMLEMLKAKAPIFKGGLYRASASRILEGDLLGYFDYDEDMVENKLDAIPHDQLRVLRGLKVFGAWTNNYDLHRKNTMDMLVDENGQKVIKHYLLDFGSSLGSAGFRPKVPAVGFETIMDLDETVKAISFAKVKEKPWEKRWDKNQQMMPYRSIGYFDNYNFNPRNWKPNLPHFTFNYMTNADAYWAAKIISKFTDEEIAAIVKTGKLSKKSAESFLIQTLIERRDMVAKYWFGQVSPLENFRVIDTADGIQITFDDLSVQKGWAPGRTYQYKAYSPACKKSGTKKEKIAEGTSEDSIIILPTVDAKKILIEISAISDEKKKQPVKVLFSGDSPHQVLSIEH